MKISKVLEISIDIPTLAQDIKSARLSWQERTGKNITQLAAQLGFTTAYIYKIEAERDVNSVPVETLIKLEDILEADLGSSKMMSAIKDEIKAYA